MRQPTLAQITFLLLASPLALAQNADRRLESAKLDGSKQAAFTKLEEVAAKATGADPFDAPDSLLEAIADKRYGGLEDKRLKTVAVNFLSDLDITGGNSGSPVLDGQGKLVGLAFDGNWESVSSNWVFDPAMTRMIAVEPRGHRGVIQGG